MSSSKKIITILYSALCFILTFIGGLIGRVGFGTVILRSILFTIITTVVVLIIGHVFPFLFKNKEEHQQTEDIDANEEFSNSQADYIGGATRMQAENAYTQNNVASSINVEETELPFNDTDPFENPLETAANNLRQEMSSPEHEKDIIANSSRSRHNEEYINRVTQNVSGNNSHTTSHNEAEIAGDNEFQGMWEREEKFDSINSKDVMYDVFSKNNSKEIPKNSYKSSLDKEIDKTLVEYQKEPEKVGKAVANWIENNDNSK